VDDAPVLGRIEQLVDEEHRLWRASEEGGLSRSEHERLHAVRVELDRCWATLRRRRAGQPVPGPTDADVPDPPNELDGPEDEPPHLERGSGRGDVPAPDPDVSRNLP
jgi:hypothetical protein